MTTPSRGRTLATGAAGDPVAALTTLSTIWFDDLGAYAAGQIEADQITCALCLCCPCHCPPFGTEAYLRLVDARHGRGRPRTAGLVSS